jgi:hypothetical protein
MANFGNFYAEAAFLGFFFSLLFQHKLGTSKAPDKRSAGQAMLVQLSHGEDEQFLLQASCTDFVDDLIRRLVATWNLRTLLRDVCSTAEDFNETHSDEDNPKLLEAIKSAQSLFTKELVAKKTLLTMDSLQGAVRDLQTAVEEAQFPAEAFKGSELSAALVCAAAQLTNPRNIEAGDSTASNEKLFDPKTACLWWCKKPFNRKHRLQRRAGTNEKTKLVVQLTRSADESPLVLRAPAAVVNSPKTAPVAATVVELSEQSEGEIGDTGTIATGVSLSHFVAAQEKARKRPEDEDKEDNWKRQRMQEEGSDEDEEWKLSGEQLAALRSSDQLLPPLRDERLQTLIRKIDSAIDRPKALEEAVQQDSRFAEFYQKILLELQIAEVRSDGNLVMSNSR